MGSELVQHLLVEVEREHSVRARVVHLLRNAGGLGTTKVTDNRRLDVKLARICLGHERKVWGLEVGWMELHQPAALAEGCRMTVAHTTAHALKPLATPDIQHALLLGIPHRVLVEGVAAPAHDSSIAREDHGAMRPGTPWPPLFGVRTKSVEAQCLVASFIRAHQLEQFHVFIRTHWAVSPESSKEYGKLDAISRFEGTHGTLVFPHSGLRHGPGLECDGDT